MNSYKRLEPLVIIVTFNASWCIEKCLKSVLNSSIKLTILIVDNNSKDSTVKIVRSRFPEVRVINNNFNLGFGKANNQGLIYAQNNGFDHVVLLNQDVYIEFDTIDKLIFFQENNPIYGIVSPIHLNKSRKDFDFNFSKCLPGNHMRSFENDSSLNSGCSETKFVNAAAWLISRECFTKIGGFDPLFNHYGEDRDYCYRVTYHGFRIGILFNSVICHDRNYDPQNNFLKEKNLLYSIALSHIKNANYNVGYNILTWILQRARKIVKWAFTFKFRFIFNEIVIFNEILSSLRVIKVNHWQCRNIDSIFLS